MEKIKRVNRIKTGNKHNKIETALLNSLDSKEKLELCFETCQTILDWQKKAHDKILLHNQEFEKIEKVLNNRLDYIKELEKRIEKLESRQK